MRFWSLFLFFVLALASLTESAPDAQRRRGFGPRRRGFGAKGGFVSVQGPRGGSFTAGGFKAGGFRRRG